MCLTASAAVIAVETGAAVATGSAVAEQPALGVAADATGSARTARVDSVAAIAGVTAIAQ